MSKCISITLFFFSYDLQGITNTTHSVHMNHCLQVLMPLLHVDVGVLHILIFNNHVFHLPKYLPLLNKSKITKKDLKMKL
jgi:hypothetical protein